MGAVYNPFRDADSRVSENNPCVLVIFGATGDLTHRKLIPALYNLSIDGALPTHFHVIAFARRSYSNEAFRAEMLESVRSHSRRAPVQENVWREFAQHLYYVQGNFGDDKGYEGLSSRLAELTEIVGGRLQRIFYFATSPSFFETIAQRLFQHGLLKLTDESNFDARVVVEKPFGNNLDSARALNLALLKYMSERQIYRIDHYLGKETVQNLLVFRFANGIFEPIWNHKYISHIEISVCESIGVEGRADFFDKAGILRDIVQNHALQLLCLVALEPPVAFEADAVRDEKLKVLRSIRLFESSDIAQNVVRARYTRGSVNAKEVIGYLEEPDIPQDSATETFVAMRLQVDNWRWAGVPIYLRAGKRLPKRVTDISIVFRQVPFGLFHNHVEQTAQNVLSFQIQPDEGISLKFVAKPPGTAVRVQSVNMDFSYGTSFGIEPPDAYERLLLDAVKGDATLFTRDDEIEAAWKVMSPILDLWQGESSMRPPVYEYAAGSWGPKAAHKLITAGNIRSWRRL